MKLILMYFKISLVAVMRNRQAAFFTIMFPALLLLMFGHQDHVSNTAANHIAVLAIYGNYAVQSVALMSFGISLSNDRNSAWTLYLRTLPVAPGMMFAGRILSLVVRALLSLIIVLLLGVFLLNLSVSLASFLLILLIAMVGAIPMALLAIAVANLVNPESARSVFVILNLGLLFGSFSVSATGLLGYVRDIIPSYQWAAMVLNQYLPNANAWAPWLWMAGFTVLFYFFALYAYQRSRNLRAS